jgi:hypothetical protein
MKWRSERCYLAGLTVMLAIAGCGREIPTQARPLGGIVRGHISDGAAIEEPFEIFAETTGGGETHRTVAAVVDVDGRFEMTLPNGKYRVSARPDCGPGSVYYRASGPVLVGAAADTVVVAGDEQELVFACGRVAISVAIPETEEGRNFRCGVMPVSATSLYYYYDCNTIADDVVATTVRFVPPGQYYLTCDDGDTRAYLPPTYDRDRAAVVDVTAGQQVTYSSAVMGYTTVAGTVTGSWQELAVGRPEVQIYGGGIFLDVRVADPDGAFAFSLLGGGSFQFRVRIDNIWQWVGGDDLETATRFAAESGDAITDIRYVESGLVCVLADPPDTNLASIGVYTSRADSTYLGNSYGDTLRMANLRPGPVYLRLRPVADTSRWLPQYFDRRNSLAEADPVEIPPAGQVARVEATVVLGGGISGRILDAAGMPPLEGQMVMALVAAADSAAVVRYCYFSSGTYDPTTGDYVINQVPDGTFKLRADAGHGDTWWPAASSFAAAGTITIENHEDVSGIAWQLLH